MSENKDSPGNGISAGNTGAAEYGEQQEISQAVYAEALADGFWYPCIQAGMEVKKGNLLGKLEDQSGEVIQEIRAEFDGVVLYFTSALGVRRGTALAAYGR